MSSTDTGTPPARDENWETYAVRTHQDRSQLAQFQKDHGASVIRGLFLLNAGASIAVLSLIGALFGKEGAKAEMVAVALFRGSRPALISFSVGLLASLVASGMAYLNFNALFDARGSPEELIRIARGGEPDKMAPWRKFVIKATFYGAPCICIISALAFIRGGMFISHAMRLALAQIVR